ncbi:MAG: hypothetical protein AAGA20_15160, partial [Planctomycetota bacterium]
MGGESAGSGRDPAETLEPSTTLTLAEAALLVGVDEGRLAALCDDGTLLFEMERRRRREVRVVRLVDLADVFPEALGSVDVSAAVPARRAEDGVADAVRASGASRDALIGLCQDLEQRLDLAERERQATTAGLLMAQRRILDLEVRARRRPLERAGVALLGFASIAAIALAVRVPGLVRDEAETGVRAIEAAVSGELGAAVAQIEELTSGDASERAAFAERIDEGRRAIEGAARDAREQLELARAEAEQRASAVAALEERLADAEARVSRRAGELDVLVDASSRERARFRERLVEAERVAGDARAALAAERRAAADERAEFERRVSELVRSARRDDEAQADELRRLREAVEAAFRAAEEPARVEAR